MLAGGRVCARGLSLSRGLMRGSLAAVILPRPPAPVTPGVIARKFSSAGTAASSAWGQRCSEAGTIRWDVRRQRHVLTIAQAASRSTPMAPSNVAEKDPDAVKMVKKKMALHIAYVGTAFRGASPSHALQPRWLAAPHLQMLLSLSHGLQRHTESVWASVSRSSVGECLRGCLPGSHAEAPRGAPAVPCAQDFLCSRAAKEGGVGGRGMALSDVTGQPCVPWVPVGWWRRAHPQHDD